MSNKLFINYMRNLVNLFFKILPMWEDQTPSLNQYMIELRDELLGNEEFLERVSADSRVLALAGSLQFLIDNPDTEIEDVRRKVFRSIRLCNKIRECYMEVV